MVRHPDWFDLVFSPYAFQFRMKSEVRIVLFMTFWSVGSFFALFWSVGAYRGSARKLVWTGTKKPT